MAEFLRLAVQLKRQGEIRESVIAAMVRRLGQWVRTALGRIKDTLPEAFEGKYGEEAKQSLKRIEEALDSLGEDSPRRLQEIELQEDARGLADGFEARGTGRISWTEVEMGDDFNAVKKHLPWNPDAPQIFDIRGTPEEVYKRIAEALNKKPTVVDPDGLKVLIANPEGFADRELLKRAEHLAASKGDLYKQGPRALRFDKARWISNIWKTVEDYGARIVHYNDIGYVRKYCDGIIHVVFVEGNKVVGHEVFDAAAVSQRALDSKTGLKGATILKKRNLPGAFPIQGEP